MSYQPWVKIGIGCLSAIILSGCSSSDHLQPLKQFVADAPHSRGYVPALPKTPVYHPDAFEGAQGNDPFVSFSDILLREEASNAQKGPHPLMKGPLQPLQKFPLSALQLDGILRWNSGQLWGVIQTPKGKVYRVTIGSLIGNSAGKVVDLDDQLSKQSITVQQYIPNAFGGYKKQTVVLHMANQ